MQTKELAIKTIENMPDEVDYDEIIHALYLNAKFENGIREIIEGKGINQEDAKEKLALNL